MHCIDARQILLTLPVVLMAGAVSADFVSGATLCNRADMDENDVVDMQEIMWYISQWYENSQEYPTWELMETLGLWKNGCPPCCPEKMVFAGYVSWFPPSRYDVFYYPSTYLTKDTPMQLSAMAPCCNSTDDRDNGLCWHCWQWTEQALIEDYKIEITDAVEHGIDGFLFYTIGAESLIPEKLGRILSAAEQVSENFKIMFAPDLALGPTNVSTFITKMSETLGPNKDHPNIYKHDDAVVISGFRNDLYSASEWEQVIQDLRDDGISVRVIGDIMPNEDWHLGITPDGERKVNDYLTVWDGITYFHPNLRQEHYAPISHLKQIVDSNGKTFMSQVHPGYYSTYPDGRYNWFVDGDISGFFRDDWEFAISEDAGLTNIVTWNDYVENHYIAPSIKHNKAFLDITGWYSHLFKYGATPDINETSLYLGHYGSVYPYYPIDIEVAGIVAENHDGIPCNIVISEDMESFSDITRNFSISLWYEFPQGAINPRWSLSKGDAWNPGNRGFGIAHWTDSDPVTPALYLNDGTNRLYLDGGSINRGEWGHFVWTVDRTAGLMKSYKNGVFQGEWDISGLGDISNATNPLVVGELLDNHFTGSMDELKVYNKILDAAEIQSLSNKQTGGSLTQGVVVSMSFNDDFFDSAGNNVTVSGDPQFVQGISESAVYFDWPDNLEVSIGTVDILNDNFILEEGFFVYEDSVNGHGNNATVELDCGVFRFSDTIEVLPQDELRWHTDSELPVHNCNHGCGGIPPNLSEEVDMSTVFRKLM